MLNHYYTRCTELENRKQLRPNRTGTSSS